MRSICGDAIGAARFSAWRRNSERKVSGLLRWLLAACLLAVLPAVYGAEFRGEVVHVLDGDSIVVVDAQHRQRRVRLAGIDAPEKGQPYANQSRRHLASLVRRKEVTVHWHRRDDWNRLVGVVSVKGRDINLEQVKAGFAWWFRAYADEQTPQMRRMYERAEKKAQLKRRGLWAEREPVPPWEWRRNNRTR